MVGDFQLRISDLRAKIGFYWEEMRWLLGGNAPFIGRKCADFGDQNHVIGRKCAVIGRKCAKIIRLLFLLQNCSVSTKNCPKTGLKRLRKGFGACFIGRKCAGYWEEMR